MSDSVLSGLDPEQRLVAEALSGPVVVLAGAGTGKTRAITHRIAHAVLTGRHPARTGMAVTFTTRAAGEMRQRLVQLGVPSLNVRTFHAAALSQLRYFWPSVVGGSFPTLMPSKVALVGQACRQVGVPSAKPVVRDVASEIEWAGSTMVTPGGYPAAAQAAGRSPVGAGADQLDHTAIARVMTEYQRLKESTNSIDFEDVLLSMVAMLGDRPDVADEVRRHYHWFTVDEYQDVTPVQERLLALWLGERDDVCVVGDPSQTIYSFAGADPEALGRFTRQWPDATEIRLDRCYRCTPQIVAVANSVILAGARMARDRGSAMVEPLNLRSQRDAGPTPEQITCLDDADEAGAVARRIKERIESGTPPREIAVLMRTNAASEPIEVAFAEAGIPYVMRGAERFFERSEVREAMARLRGEAAATGRGAAATGRGAGGTGRAGAGGSGGPGGGAAGGGAPGGGAAGGGAAGGGAAGGGASGGGAAGGGASAGASGGGPAAPGEAAAPSLAEQVRAVLAGMGWQPTAPTTGGASRERWESLSALVALAEDSAGIDGLADLVADLERRAQMAHAPSADGVTVTTLHAAKGLEWSSVFMVGCAEGTLPIVYATTDERIDEERRLFYVGMTRARDRLTLSWAMTRGGSGRRREPSRFLAEMRTRARVTTAGSDPSGPAPAAAGVVRQGRSRGPRERRRRQPGRCRVCGAGLVTAPERTLNRCATCPGTPDEDLAEQLRQWRSATAKDRAVPAYVVFTDLTLNALAELRPTTREALLDIPGIGPAKVDLYGEVLLGLIAAAAEGTAGTSGVAGGEAQAGPAGVAAQAGPAGGLAVVSQPGGGDAGAVGGAAQSATVGSGEGTGPAVGAVQAAPAGPAGSGAKAGQVGSGAKSGQVGSGLRAGQAGSGAKSGQVGPGAESGQVGSGRRVVDLRDRLRGR